MTPDAPTWSSIAPPPRRRRSTLPIIAGVLAGLVVLVAVAVAAYAAGRHSTDEPASVGAAPTCEVLGVNGCETKGADGGGPAIAPTKLAEHSPIPSSAPVAPPPPAVPTIDDGTWTVGTDVPAGTYRTEGVAGADCYWDTTKSGSNGSQIVDQHVGGGHLTAVLRVGVDFDTARCGTWRKVG